MHGIRIVIIEAGSDVLVSEEAHIYLISSLLPGLVVCLDTEGN